MTILIADDDADDLKFFSDAVSELYPEAVCITALNGIEALKLLEGRPVPPDYIFLDLNMPRMDGKQCLKHVKNNPRFTAIPLIIYSTSKRIEDIAEVTDAGAAAFIVKPHKFDLLKREIANAILQSSL